MGMLGQVREWLRGDRRLPRTILSDMTANYEAELQAAVDLRAHAKRVPYPQAAASLLELATAADRHADRLRKHIALLGGTTPVFEPTPYEGLNHWDRMATSFRKADEKRRRYLEQSIHWDIEYPRQARLLGDLASDETANRSIIEELTSRADSLASD
jgi:Ser/Thr protein kinase RdoA (MazF antagonist)